MFVVVVSACFKASRGSWVDMRLFWHCMQVSLASEFLWNWNSREASAAFGYDYVLRQCRLRGRVDTDGKVNPGTRIQGL